MMNNDQSLTNRCDDQCGCHSHVTRRDFIRIAGVSTVALLTAQLPAMAGPFTREDFDKLVPTDKKLNPDWVKSLFARGTPEIWSGEQLKYIGMPVGGIGAGQLYLGGDGKLWHWDIFNQNIGTKDRHYAKPMLPASSVENEFTLNGTPLKKFSDISFRGEYPFGIVTYREKDVEVTLEAFSPFIPLHTDDSSLPATVLQFTLRNTATAAVEVTLMGHLENAVCLHHRQQAGTRRNRVVTEAGLNFLECTAVNPDAQDALEKLNDYGSMGLALLGAPADVASGEAAAPIAGKLVGQLGRKLKLDAGQSATVSFVLTWWFPNQLMHHGHTGRYYATRFDSALAVARYVSANFDRLTAQTRLWRDTWYDSTLPYWFLDRTFLNTSILATSTAQRFKNGRFWGWEGVGCCHGTCTHVWHYAQAVARLFPELERDLRERTDFGTAIHRKTGVINHRGETDGLAVDGQAGCILRAYREHQMSANDAFLKRLWPRIKQAMQCLIDRDTDADGLLDGPQHNTLDAAWFGHVAWLSSLYVAALRACEAMAAEVGDEDFAQQVRTIAAAGSASIDKELFNGEYYYQIGDPAHAQTVGSYNGCEIDQVCGQSWAWQVGLGRIQPEANVKTALRSLWKYNFAPDVGPYRAAHKSGRWYAMAGEGGLLMCSWPKGQEQRVATGYDYYFNECMTGFEYQAAGHMIWEGMVQEGLAITRAIHDRYHPSRRNPWNEVECGDHYARAMASYGVYLAACGFEHHGPKGHIGFAPRLSPDSFKAAFTTAEGWGTYSQKSKIGNLRSLIEVKWGQLRVRTIALPAGTGQVTVKVAGRKVASSSKKDGDRLLITLPEPVAIVAGEKIEITTS
jgi:uncharacterized protein (DUF608 family)